jgi:hypothetical protein
MANLPRAVVTSLSAIMMLSGATTETAHPAEVKGNILFVVLKEDNGKTSGHYQTSSECQRFLSDFRRLRKQGIAVRLKFSSPDGNGEVLEACCIHPDGSIGAWRGR